MKHSPLSLITFLLALSVLPALAGATSMQRAPNPVIQIIQTEPFEKDGKKFMKYHFAVDNRAAYPAAMFAEAPDLPPCGMNNKASRTWIDVFAQDGKRLNGFCALYKPDDLGDIWFSLAEEATPPSWIFIEMTDRKTNTKYKSNLAETSQ